MSLVQLAAESGAGIRWLVYQAPIRQPRFGERTRDVLRWHSRAYLADTAGVNRVFLEEAVQGKTLASAHLRARNECRRFYRKNTR
ncbi:hypothetical protein [Microbacterium sp.]|uniref:hypothetical protein n=1 Tax=Microbacterium sp. TaxID=51671 RepID=UPI0037C946CE